jgi:hypothetical protein
MAKMEITLDPEAKAAIEALTDQVKALRDLLETRAGTEHHYHFQGATDVDIASAVASMVRAQRNAV